MNIYDKFHWNSSSKWREISSSEMGINGETDGRTDGRPESIVLCTRYCWRRLGHNKVKQKRRWTRKSTEIVRVRKVTCDRWIVKKHFVKSPVFNRTLVVYNGNHIVQSKTLHVLLSKLYDHRVTVTKLNLLLLLLLLYYYYYAVDDAR